MDQEGGETSGKSIIKRTSDYVNTLFRSSLPPGLVYHDVVHTRQVVRAARRLAKGAKLSDDGLEIVTLSAWLHDIGYTQTYDGHEEVSARLAREFLLQQGLPSERMDLVADCILATRSPRRPLNTLAAIVCDADLAHLAGKEFFQRNELLRLEWQLERGEFYSDLEWDRRTFDFLLGHPFHTNVATSELHDGRVENLLLLAERIRQLEQDEARRNERLARRDAREDLVRAELQEQITARQRETELRSSESIAGLDAQQRRLDLLAQDIQTRLQGRNARLELELEVLRIRMAEAEERLARERSSGREVGPSMRTTLTIASDNHRRLQEMMDRKARTLVGLGTFTATAGLLLASVASIHFSFVLLPSLLLLLGSLLTIYWGALVLRPRPTAGLLEPDASGGYRKTLLFYGNVHRMTLDEYREAMDRLLRGSDEMKDALVRDLYFAGRSLARKARALRSGFILFVAGMTVAAIAFPLAFLLR